jgi:hypothetical protein
MEPAKGLARVHRKARETEYESGLEKVLKKERLKELCWVEMKERDWARRKGTSRVQTKASDWVSMTENAREKRWEKK